MKLRWNLSVDRREKRALTRVAAHCSGQAGPGHEGSRRPGWLQRRRWSAAAELAALAAARRRPDPRFSYCYQAIAAGYGPYYRGRDPEYAWYEDADHDGVVCE